MQTIVQSEAYGLGYQLADWSSIPRNKLDLLFAALFLTSIGVFIGGNLLLLDVSVLQRSVQVALPCFALLLIFYALSRSIRNVAWGLVLTYSAMWIMVYSRQPWLVTVVYSAALVALGYVIRFLRVERAYWLPLILMAIIATATVLGVEGAYTSFDMLNRLHAGQVHQDTLFHASIAAMIKNYGLVSTGLHGLVETPYHALSHTLFAGISLLSGVGVIEVYGVANWVFFAPILIFTIVICSAMLHKTNQLNMPLAWGITCLLLIASPRLLQPWGVWDSFFVSESYLVSLGLFLVGFPLLFKRRLSISDLLLVLTLTALIANAKMSVGLLLVGLWFARVLFVRSESISLDVAAFVVSAAVVTWMVFHSAEATGDSIRIVPLHFIAHYSFLGKHLLETGKALLEGGRVSSRSIFLALVALLSFFRIPFLACLGHHRSKCLQKGYFVGSRKSVFRLFDGSSCCWQPGCLSVLDPGWVCLLLYQRCFFCGASGCGRFACVCTRPAASFVSAISCCCHLAGLSIECPGFLSSQCYPPVALCAAA